MDDKYTLMMEYNLSIGVHAFCCASYLMMRSNVLIPAMLETAQRLKQEPDEVCFRYVNELHRRLTSDEENK